MDFVPPSIHISIIRYDKRDLPDAAAPVSEENLQSRVRSVGPGGPN